MDFGRNHIKVFVSSTVYNFETDLRRIFTLLDAYGYDVYMSKEGTIPLNSQLSNLINCVNGVEDCDVFLGIIRPLVGSGVLKKGERSITAREFDKAIEIGIPRYILADYRVEFAHQFLKLMRISIDDIPMNKERKTTKDDGQTAITLAPNNLIQGECVDIYRKAIQDHINPATMRVGNWAQPFKDGEDILRFIEAQFKDVNRIKKLIYG